MAKSKKDEQGSGELMISLEQFTRTRDSVIMSLSNLQAGLTHVQNGLNELLRAYMQHTASVLAGENIAETLQLPPHITATANAAVEAAGNAANALGQAMVTAPKLKRKREKKVKDPNAPKRPLTAMFLYASAARDIVKGDLAAALGPEEKIQPNAVNLEITKRWNEMPDEDKERWRASYRDSLATYLEEKAKYEAKTGVNDNALHDHDDEQSDEAEAGALDSDASSDSEDDSPTVAPTPVKITSPPVANTKTPRPNKRQKTAPAPQVNGNGAAVPVSIAPATANTTAVPFPIIPSTRMTQVPVPGPSSELPMPTPAKEKKDKKKKAAPQPIAPAPVKEPSPDDPKKKAKGARSTRNTEVEADPAIAAAATPTTELKGPAKKRDRSKRKSEGAAV